MTELLKCYQGSVNQWECDENDHMNVRFFLEKAVQTLHLGLVDLGVVTLADSSRIESAVLSQHLRFLAEARSACPVHGSVGIIEVESNYLKVLVELAHGSSQKKLSTVVFELNMGSMTNRLTTISQPENAGGRGIPEKSSDYGHLNYYEALKAGFRTIGRGVVQTHEAGRNNGEMAWHQYMGRTSDSVPNLWSAAYSPETGKDRQIGRAVIEARTEFYNRLSLGDHFEVLAGMGQLADKVQQSVVRIFDIRANKPISTSTVASLLMDLSARKAIPLPPEQRRQMQPLLLQKPAVA